MRCEKAIITCEEAHVLNDSLEIKTTVRASNVDDMNGNCYVSYLIKFKIKIEANYFERTLNI